MISKGCLARYTGPGDAGHLRHNEIYLVISSPYMTDYRRRSGKGWGCIVLLNNGESRGVDIGKLEKVQ